MDLVIEHDSTIISVESISLTSLEINTGQGQSNFENVSLNSIEINTGIQGPEGIKGDKGDKGEKGDNLSYSLLTSDEKLEIVTELDKVVGEVNYTNIFTNVLLS